MLNVLKSAGEHALVLKPALNVLVLLYYLFLTDVEILLNLFADFQLAFLLLELHVFLEFYIFTRLYFELIDLGLVQTLDFERGGLRDLPCLAKL